MRFVRHNLHFNFAKIRYLFPENPLLFLFLQELLFVSKERDRLIGIRASSTGAQKLLRAQKFRFFGRHTAPTEVVK